MAATTALSVHNLTAGTAVNRVPGVCECDVLLASPGLPHVPPDAGVTPLPDDTRLSVSLNAPLRIWDELWGILCSRFGALETQAEADDERDGLAVIPTVGRVETTADGLRVGFDCRFRHDVEPDAVFALVESAVNEVRQRHPDFTIAGAAVAHRPPLNADEGGLLATATAHAVAAEGFLPVFGEVAGCSEGGTYAGAGREVAVFGPGLYSDAAIVGHESILVKHIETATRVYRDVIRRICT